MKDRRFITVIGGVALWALASAPAFAQTRQAKSLDGLQEVPVISTTGKGKFSAKLSNDKTHLDYTLTYSDLESNVIMAHIHLGQPGVNGGVVVWLCSNLPSPPTPAGVQPCAGTTSGTVTGTITAADVQDVPAQGISAGELDEVINVTNKNKGYVNVHTVDHPGGEIRGQFVGN